MLPFLGFLFLSYEFFSDYQKKNWWELLETDRNGLLKSMLAKDGILLILLVVVYFVVFCMEIYWFHWFDAPGALLKNGYRVLFFNYFFLPFMGIQVGKAVIGNRENGFLGVIYGMTDELE